LATDAKLISAFSSAPFDSIQKELAGKHALTLSGAGNTSAKALLIGHLACTRKQPILWAVNDPGEARALAQHLAVWQGHPVSTFIADNAEESPRERAIRLMQAYFELRRPGHVLITSYIDAQTHMPDEKQLHAQSLIIRAGEELSRTYFFNDLITRGYENVTHADELVFGSYMSSGSTVQIFPPNMSAPVTIDLDGDRVESIIGGDNETELVLFPIDTEHDGQPIAAAMPAGSLVIADEIIIDERDDSLPSPASWLAEGTDIDTIHFTSFPEEETDFIHLRFLSVLKYVTVQDLITDLRTKKEQGWHVLIPTKQGTELKTILHEHNFIFDEGLSEAKPGVHIIEVEEDAFVPQAFQNPELKMALMTDREIFGFQRAGKSVSEQKVYLDFITSLRDGDFVVHLDHGIGIFRGIEQKTVEDVTREYLRIDYAEQDKLFVPIDQAEKVNRYIGAGDTAPKLTRLGSAEWTTVTHKVAAETEKVAKELLALYAAREMAKGKSFGVDGDKQAAFEAGFPYEETPGQLRAIQDVKQDMESDQPMDRLVCGDVGFGKTEVAMRAAFKAALAGRQVAFISPITILTDQHYKSFKRRLEGFDISCEMLSRFKTAAEQKKILAGMADGSVQIVIGTHRLIQPDVKFKDLGLVVIDEEQRFGVKQKEKLKALRNQVDILTMTATPIPRTLNMALNKLRDITTITTPPPGRLPIVTEVRHMSWKLITDAIRAELARGGQMYFLHNRVATIEGVADRLRDLVPEAKFVVTHGQLKPEDMENRIMDFKNGTYDVLISSTIIENGIDVPNANTLIVNNAENFGLSQLYQLRGRVGRSRTQAYAYFLYQTKSLKTDAKKRLRAIVEASELGSGFEVAMKDLEIRGAGDILGASQSGAINTIGVSHFVRMLNKAVEDLKAGKNLNPEDAADAAAEKDVALEIPLTAFIPVSYISDTKEKIRAYQRLSSADSEQALEDLRSDLADEYGRLPIEVMNLVKVLRLKLACRIAGIRAVKVARTGVKSREGILILGKKIKPAHIMNALSINPKWAIAGDKLRIDITDLGVDWIAGLQASAQALQTAFKADAVHVKK